MQTVRFGIIGCGLMGREFVSAALRWPHLTNAAARVEVAAICNRALVPEKIEWFTNSCPTIRQVTADYRELLANPEVDAVYCAVPHHLHGEIYCAAIDAGKHLLGEKPFGMDLKASEAIRERLVANPEILARCASQYVFYPAVQRMLEMAKADAFGRIIEIESGFLHSSDLNPEKPINWKRMNEFNGEYGVLGDLGLHVAFLPFRMGVSAENVRAVCSNIVPERPDGAGNRVPCDTWDNVTLLAEASDPRTGMRFPWTLRIARIMPGEMNTLYLAVYGTRGCARYTTKNPKRLQVLEYTGGEQIWRELEFGFQTAYPTITGPIFDLGSPDAFMQLMAAFVHELVHGRALSTPAGCPTPGEMHACHELFTAALRSHREGNVAPVRSAG